MELRMRRFAAPVLVRAKRLPFDFGEDVWQPQARQYDASLGHPCDPRDQRGDGRSGGCNARGHREPGRRLVLPLVGQPVQQAVASLG